MELTSSNPTAPSVTELITPSQLERGENRPRINHEDDDDISPSCCENTLDRIKCVYESCHGIYDTCNRFYYRYTNRTVRNIIRLGLAGGMSYLGGIIAADPRIGRFLHLSQRGAVHVGAGVGGVANAASTYYAYEEDTHDRISALEARQRILEEIRIEIDRRLSELEAKAKIQ